MRAVERLLLASGTASSVQSQTSSKKGSASKKNAALNDLGLMTTYADEAAMEKAKAIRGRRILLIKEDFMFQDFGRLVKSVMDPRGWQVRI